MSEASRQLLFEITAIATAAVFGAIAVRGLWRAWRRGLVGLELRHHFLSPIAWITLAGFALINGVLFVVLLERFAATPNVPIVQIFFASGFFWVLQLVIVPLITMRGFAHERSTGTLEPLLTAPVTPSDVVWGKFAGTLLLYAALWLPTAILLLLAFHHAAPPGWWSSLWALRTRGLGEAVRAAIAHVNAVMDMGPVLSACLGTAALGAAWVAVGLLASALSRSQITAFTGGFVALLCLYLLGELPTLITASPSWAPGLREALLGISLSAAFADFSRGVLDTRALLYLLSICGVALFFTARVVESERWR